MRLADDDARRLAYHAARLAEYDLDHARVLVDRTRDLRGAGPGHDVGERYRAALGL